MYQRHTAALLQGVGRKKRKPTSELKSHSSLTWRVSVFHAIHVVIFSSYFRVQKRPLFAHTRQFLLHFFPSNFILHLIFEDWTWPRLAAAGRSALNRWGRLRLWRVFLANECITTEGADNVNVAIGWFGLAGGIKEAKEIGTFNFWLPLVILSSFAPQCIKRNRWKRGD